MPYADKNKRREANKIYHAKWLAKNPDYYRNYDRKYWLENKVRITAVKKAYREANKEKFRAYAKNYYKGYSHDKYISNAEAKKAHNLTPIGKLSKYKTRAKSKGIVFALDFSLFNSILIQDCHYCGKPNANCIDRIDSSKGYEQNNVLPCCSTCNMMKMTLSYENFLKQIELMHQHLSKKSNGGMILVAASTDSVASTISPLILE